MLQLHRWCLPLDVAADSVSYIQELFLLPCGHSCVIYVRVLYETEVASNRGTSMRIYIATPSPRMRVLPTVCKCRPGRAYFKEALDVTLEWRREKNINRW